MGKPASQSSNTVSLKDILRIFLVFAGACLCGCGDSGGFSSDLENPQVNVVIAVGEGSRTRTEYNAENKRFEWSSGDALAVWAKSSDGTYPLDGRTFRLLAVGANRSSAYFTATLDAPMEEGTYSYYVAYPSPESIDGTTARFVIPSVQDGKASGGVDVIVAEPVSGPALAPMVEAVPISPEASLKIRMRHLLHFLRFYIPDGNNPLGEPVKRIEFSMPRPIAGNLTVDVTDAGSAALGNGTNSIVLDLETPLDESGSAVAGIFPPSGTYSSEDQMAVTVYSENKWATLDPLQLAGRTFPAGHLTPVPLRPAVINEFCQLRFTLASNNLGEDPRDIKVSLPKGETWPGTDSNVLDFTGEHNGLVKVGDTFALKIKDVDSFRSLSFKTLAVTYESESAIVSESVMLGDFSSLTSAVCRLNCPYLFFEDFSGVESFNSNDEYKTANAGSKNPELFLNGWSAARAGAQKGTAIRLACRRETSARYPARADSPILGLKDNIVVNLDVTFDYSMDRRNGGIGPVDVSQNVYFGYINATRAEDGTDPGSKLESGDDSGTFPEHFVLDETSGTYSNINHLYNAVLSNVETPVRLSWRTNTEYKAGANNNTCWLYIDNIKVKIKK